MEMERGFCDYLRGLIWVIPSEGSGNSHLQDSCWPGGLNPGTGDRGDSGLCLQLQWVSCVHPVASRPVLWFPWNYQLAACVPGWPAKEDPREVIWAFHFPFWRRLNFIYSLQVFIMELVLYGIFLQKYVFFYSCYPFLLFSFYAFTHPSIQAFNM